MKLSLLLVLASFLVFVGCKPQRKQMVPKVQTYKVKGQSVPIFQSFIGQVYGAKDIAIRARVEGYVKGIFFYEGTPVSKGQLLYTLESQTYEAKVAEQQSKVASAKANLVKAKNDLNRIKPLARQRAVSKSDLDAAVANFDASESSLRAAEAALQAAEIQLSYTKIYSPIDGIIGKTKFKVGDLVGSSAEDLTLNVVSEVDSVRVEFFLPENMYLNIVRNMDEKTEAARKKRTELQLILSDGSRYPYKGKVDFIDRNIDPDTGAILIQATFPNPDNTLRPGLFARVEAKINEVENGILIPQRSVTELQGLFQVAIVDKDKKVKLKTVDADQRVGNFWFIKSGLSTGEEIVYEGILKIREGMVVQTEVVDVKMIKEGKKDEK